MKPCTTHAQLVELLQRITALEDKASSTKSPKLREQLEDKAQELSNQFLHDYETLYRERF